MKQYTVRLSSIEYCIVLEVEEIAAVHSGELDWRPVGHSELMFESCFKRTGRTKFRYIFNMANGDSIILHGDAGQDLYENMMSRVAGQDFAVITVEKERE